MHASTTATNPAYEMMKEEEEEEGDSRKWWVCPQRLILSSLRLQTIDV